MQIQYLALGHRSLRVDVTRTFAQRLGFVLGNDFSGVHARTSNGLLNDKAREVKVLDAGFAGIGLHDLLHLGQGLFAQLFLVLAIGQ